MSALQTVTLCLILVAGAVVVILFMKKRNTSEWGLKDVVKNPSFWKQAAATREQVEAAAREAQGWNDEKVAAAAKHFVLEVKSSRGAWAEEPISKGAWTEERILKGLGGRTHRTVIELLRDPSHYDRLVKGTSEHMVPEAPFNRACDLLGDSPPAEAVEVLAPFLSDASKEIRKEAALTIARTGADTIGPLVKKAFSDKDEYVRSYALMGLRFSLNRSGLSESLRKELFPGVLALLREDKNAHDAAEILYRLDREQASDFFLSEQVFTADSPILHEVLKVLANARAEVPRKRIQGLIAALEGKEMEYPRTYALGEALRLLGQHRLEEDRDFLGRRMDHSDKRVAQGASAGLLCSYGLEGFEERIWEIEKKVALCPGLKGSTELS